MIKASQKKKKKRTCTCTAHVLYVRTYLFVEDVDVDRLAELVKSSIIVNLLLTTSQQQQANL